LETPRFIDLFSEEKKCQLKVNFDKFNSAFNSASLSIKNLEQIKNFSFFGNSTDLSNNLLFTENSLKEIFNLYKFHENIFNEVFLIDFNSIFEKNITIKNLFQNIDIFRQFCFNLLHYCINKNPEAMVNVGSNNDLNTLFTLNRSVFQPNLQTNFQPTAFQPAAAAPMFFQNQPISQISGFANFRFIDLFSEEKKCQLKVNFDKFNSTFNSASLSIKNLEQIKNFYPWIIVSHTFLNSDFLYQLKICFYRKYE